MIVTLMYVTDALIGILIVVSWLEVVGQSLANVVKKYYAYFYECFERYIKRKNITAQNKVGII